MNVLDLFSGIGGFSLGLERAGMRTVAFCEIEPFCRRVLAKHWPSVPCYDDVRSLTADRLRTDGIVPEVICGGFPCQDISVAGRGAGIDGERSGLWSEYARIIGEIRPRFVIVENVAALLGRGLDRVLGDLATLGYDAEWHCIPASAVGAPHRRDRIWIVANSEYRALTQRSWPQGRENGERPAIGCLSGGDGEDRALANAASQTDGLYHAEPSERQVPELGIRISASDVADANRGDGQWGCRPLQMGWGRFAREAADDGELGRIQWGFEPDVGRVAHGVPDRVDRLRGLGNAVVPQIPEIIGRAIMARALCKS